MTGYCPFRKGTLLILSGPVNHLHIVMNDPVYYPERGYHGVLLVNISTVRDGRKFDSTCLFHPGEHPFVIQQSYVVYSEAVVKNAEDISQFVNMGEFTPRAPISDHLYERTLAGFHSSPRVTPKIKRFIKNYMQLE
ncbi:MAG TPA: hypothetical protein DDZ35_02630 [Halomonas sp.]|nr:hypothetical protein [Halomonas sp.]